MTPFLCAYGAEHKWQPTGVAMKTWTTYNILPMQVATLSLVMPKNRCDVVCAA